MRPWVKCHLAMITERRFRTLSDSAWRRYCEMLIMAGETDEQGLIGGLGDIVYRLTGRDDTDFFIPAMRELTGAGLIVADEDGLFWIVDWSNTQPPRTAADRKRAQRARNQRQLPAKIDGHNHVTGLSRDSHDQRREDQVYNEIKPLITYIYGDNMPYQHWEEVPEEKKVQVRATMALIDMWAEKTKAYIPRHDSDALRLHFVNPAYDLLERVGFAPDTAIGMLMAERQEMIDANLKPTRLSAVVPRVLANLDKTEATAPAQFYQPEDLPTDDQVEAVLRSMGAK